mmetsp:Transcript_101128/g.200861  ORF Transcript_101128/g.200861 Transcript_101128/m.200861 type:complete len:88 (+) Transcript_101128:165-428(+)
MCLWSNVSLENLPTPAATWNPPKMKSSSLPAPRTEDGVNQTLLKTARPKRSQHKGQLATTVQIRLCERVIESYLDSQFSSAACVKAA